MNPDLFPEDIRSLIIPEPRGRLVYRCLGCRAVHPIETLLYVCPECRQVLMIENDTMDIFHQVSGQTWQRIFDYRKMLKMPALNGIYRYHEFIGSIIPLTSVVYLGEGHTPMIEANAHLQEKAGVRFFFKNDGQNPSASFKDRGMASAFSCLKYLIDRDIVSDVMAVCASTGDTSAAAALYAAYLYPMIKSAVLLPHKKVTAQQLSQPLGSGATVFEIPGVFDDCMKVVEHLSENYTVALLNSKNAWRILGQESFSYEIAQDMDWQLSKLAVVVPIGNAGNISAIMNGFIKFYSAGIIDVLPKIVGVQSAHADPVYRYYREKDPALRQFEPVHVKPSVAQAAMIGNPVSMPRVVELAEQYDSLAGEQRIFVCRVTEQDIMDCQLAANRNGHIACTQGGESLAGLMTAVRNKIVDPSETAVVDSTAHAIKFSEFQNMYFDNQLPSAYQITPDMDHVNKPVLVTPGDPGTASPSDGSHLDKEALARFARDISDQIAKRLNLKKIND